MKKSFILVWLAISIYLFGSDRLWALNPQLEPPTSPASIAKITKITVDGTKEFNQSVCIATTGPAMINKPVAHALLQLKENLLKDSYVEDVVQLKGNNLFVRFKDGNELLMFLGKDNLGGEELRVSPESEQGQLLQPQENRKGKVEVSIPGGVTLTKPEIGGEESKVLDKASPKLMDMNEATPLTEAILAPGVMTPFLLPCSPNSNKALVFDCLEDDHNVVAPKISHR